jgi:hypothetical protein
MFWEINIVFQRKSLDESGHKNVRIILKRILMKQCVRVFTGLNRQNALSSDDFCEYYNETSGSIKGGEVLDH